MQTASIHVEHLEKKFPKSKALAVSNLNFDIYPGESVAFLGANGAGKSTTIKMLCGIITPSQGCALINGLPAGSLAANQHLGLVFGTRSQLYLHMTVLQCFDLIAEIYYVTGREKKSRIEALSDAFQINALLERRVRTLSLGQRMRCELIAALLHNPAVLLLDEPTIGLDMIAKNQLRELLHAWKKKETTTIMLTSHDLSDVEILCERCILIDHGMKRFDGPLNSLKGPLAWVRRIYITLKKPQLAPVAAHEHLLHIKNPSDHFVHAYELQSDQYPMAEALHLLSSHYSTDLQDIQISDISLEEVLRKIYQP